MTITLLIALLAALVWNLYLSGVAQDARADNAELLEENDRLHQRIDKLEQEAEESPWEQSDREWGWNR